MLNFIGLLEFVGHLKYLAVGRETESNARLGTDARITCSFSFEYPAMSPLLDFSDHMGNRIANSICPA